MSDTEQKAWEFAWPTIEDFEKCRGYLVSEPVKLAWTMARTTNGTLSIGKGPRTAAARIEQLEGSIRAALLVLSCNISPEVVAKVRGQLNHALEYRDG